MFFACFHSKEGTLHIISNLQKINFRFLCVLFLLLLILFKWKCRHS